MSHIRSVLLVVAAAAAVPGVAPTRDDGGPVAASGCAGVRQAAAGVRRIEGRRLRVPVSTDAYPQVRAWIGANC